MDKITKTKILLALYSYKRNKKLVESAQEYIEAHRQLLQALQSVQVIDVALAELPADIKEYVQEKYFDRVQYTPDELLMRFNVADKTISRWDKVLLTAVYRYLEVSKF